MKLLFDQNISFRIARKLNDVFPACKHVSDCRLNNSEDAYIWKFARNNDFAIVTFDSDFYDFSVIYGHPPKVIWICSGNLSTNQLVELLIDHQISINEFLTHEKFTEQSCLVIR